MADVPVYVLSVCTDVLGPPVQELRQWDSWTLTRSVRDPATLTVSNVPGEHPDAARVVELATDLMVHRDGVALFRGRVVGGTDQVTEQSAVCGFSATDYRGLLTRRITRTPLTFAATDQADIAWALVTHAQAPDDLGITRGLYDAGTPRDRTYEAGAPIGELLGNLGEVVGGFEWWIDPDKTFQMAERRGTEKNSIIDLGGVLATCDREVQSGSYANAVWFSGDQGATDPVLAEASSIPPGQRYEVALSQPNVTEQDTVADKAAQAVTELMRTHAVYRVTFMAGRWSPSLLDVGDYARLLVRSGRLAVLGEQVRCVEVVIAYGSNGAESVSASLVSEPGLSVAGVGTATLAAVMGGGAGAVT